MTSLLPAAAELRLKARIAGGLYLVSIACGFFAEMAVRSKLVVHADAVVTAANILGSPMLYRAGFFADLTAMLSGVLSSVVLYRLLTVVSRTGALAMLTLDIVSNAISMACAILLYAPLVVLPAGSGTSAFAPGELPVLSLLCVRLYELAYAVSLGVFGVSCLLTGYLIVRSRFLPKTLGILLAVGGFCYLVNSFTDLMPKGFGDFLFPWVLLPTLLGEAALALWLTFVGLDARQWLAAAGLSDQTTIDGAA